MLVHEGEVVSAASNEVEKRSDPTAHAELLCIQKGAKLLGESSVVLIASWLGRSLWVIHHRVWELLLGNEQL